MDKQRREWGEKKGKGRSGGWGTWACTCREEGKGSPAGPPGGTGSLTTSCLRGLKESLEFVGQAA